MLSWAPGATPGILTFENNAFADVDTTYAFQPPNTNFSPTSVNLENNWWGTTSQSAIDDRVFDRDDDILFREVDFVPFLTAPPVSAPPAPTTNLAAQTANTSISLAWDTNIEADIAGYKVYYDTDAPGFPFANVVDVGNVTAHTLTGLTTGTTYYLSVTAYDTSADESWHSGSAQTSVGEPRSPPSWPSPHSRAAEKQEHPSLPSRWWPFRTYSAIPSPPPRHR